MCSSPSSCSSASSSVSSAVDLLKNGRRGWAWYVVAALYLLTAVLWVQGNVVVQYFIIGDETIERRWSEVLPYLGSSPTRVLSMGLHFVCGSVITLLGVWQVSPLSRTSRTIAWHRWTGRLFVLCAVGTTIGGLGFIVQQRRLVGGYSMTASFAIYGLLVFGTSVQAWRTARQGDIDAHRRWAMRAFSMGVASFLYRFYYFLGQGFGVVHAPDKTPYPPLFRTPFMRFDEWWFFVPNLLVVELLLRARDGKAQRLSLDLFLAMIAASFIYVMVSMATMQPPTGHERHVAGDAPATPAA